ncbi:phage portal protein [Siphonobacter sp. BAB-5385]|uniref:phage portal protein n=1 Tax=Siphonobacter sp. BAB-5385 TaxID=1864822 RepID=UPI000B9E90F2|nr:phage portal protein [Siphonobacter sp. BAB-5385]OZI06599.1 phage portal protein [Siphonobacter sp. BAB-5385]
MAFWNLKWPFKRTSASEQRSASVGHSLTDATGELSKILGLHLDQVRVNATAAMNLSAFFGSVRVMSSLFSTLPVAHLQKKDGRRVEVEGDMLTEVLTLRASRHVNAVDFKKALMANLLVYGNGVARIVKNKYRETEELIVYKFTDVTIIETDDRLYYHFPGGIVCDEEEVIHLKFLTLDGKIGIAPWGFAPKTFKVALSAQEFISKYYQNGTFLGGILTSEANLDETKAKAAKQMWKDSTKQGVQNTGDITVLGNGLKFHEIGSKPVESQMVEFFAKTDVDIYRMMGVPGHMMGDASQNNTWGGTGIESQFMSFINIALMTFIQSFEQEVAYKCIRTDKRWGGST